MKQFIITTHYGNRTKRLRVSAENEQQAINSADCKKTEIISIREAAYKKLTPEEVAQKNQDKRENKNWEKDLERLEAKGALLSDHEE